MSLYFDGASKGNPGESSAASVLITEDKTFLNSEYFIKATNNESEYKGLIIGLETAISNNIKNLKVYGDSKLVIMQSKKLWKVKSPNLIELSIKVQNLIKEFDSIEFNHILREFNQEADKLANETIQLKSGINQELIKN